LHGRTGPQSFAWGKSPNVVSEIVGRDHELARVRALLEATREGATTTLVVEGEPGIGKTTLLEAAERMATGFRCLWVRGVESESVLAHAGLLQALSPVRDGLAEIPGAQATALSLALGWGPAAAPSERFLVAAGVLSLLAAQSERAPVLVLVDDLQWVDRESAAALGFAARRLHEDPVCFVWAARSGSISPEFVRGMPVLTLTGLSRAGALALVPERVADGVLDRLVDDTGGNPLGILEIVRRLTDAQRVGAAPLPDALPVGDRLGLVYKQQLGGLSGPAWRAVLLSALNRSGTSTTVATALLREGVDVAAALDEAQDLGVLVRHGAEIGFRHPLLRTSVLAMATSAQQRLAHRALADVLAGDPLSLARTWHRAEAAAGPDKQLAQDLVRAADQSRTRQGYAAASAAMERAALLTDDAALTAEWMATAAADAFLAGDADRTRSLVARVLDGWSQRRAHGRALFTLGMLEEYAGSVPYAVDLLAAAAERLDGAHRTRVLAELALAHFRLNDVAGIGECAARIQEAADPNDPEQRMLSDFTRGVAATLGGDPAAGAALLRDVTERISGPPLSDDPRSLIFLGLAGGFLGDPRDAMAAGSQQLSQVRNRGALGVLVPALALFAAARAWLGDHAGAFADAGEASELGDQLGYAADAAVAVEMLAWQSAARGLHEAAHTALKRAKSLTDRAGTTGFAAHQAMTAAFCALCRADPATAVSLLEARIAADGGVGSMGEPLGVAPYLVEAYVAVGRRDDAIAVVERFAAVTPPTAPPWLRALVARCRGLTADDDETAVQAFEAALSAHTDAPDTFETARTRLLYGARLRRSGQRVKAREQLRTAHDAFAEMDLTAWVLRAADELAATGAKPRTRRPQPTEPLTSQETRVALHAAKGMSNKEIAAALFLSPKTVEHHLSSVYRKRGFRSRAELAGSFHPREDR
jgi:DNA-binding NarL/FixJ family response regulator